MTVALATRQTYLPYCLPDIGEAEIAEVVDSLRAGWVSTGPKVQRFEQQFAATAGCGHALAVSSCTAALQIALDALGVSSGDEVILPAITFCSAANVILHLGARPVPVDVGADWNLLPDEVERAVGPRTRAIMPAHFGGQACDLSALYRIAARHRLPLVIDAAHASGCTYRGLDIAADELFARLAREAGGEPVPVVNAFSFYATKNMTTGEGGMLATADAALAERMALLRLHGMSRDAWKRYLRAGNWLYDVLAPGYKANMTDLAAALGIHQLRRLPEFVRRRQHLAARYHQRLGHLPEVALPAELPERNHVFHLYVIALELERLAIGRDEFIARLADHQIGASVHFVPLHRFTAFRELFADRAAALPNAERTFGRVLSLPLYPRMSDEDVDYVAAVVAHLVATNRNASCRAQS